ncbi:MAG: hypothetical protein KKF20_01985 [Bacteroidetes bacterium]|nr:hypothetical protein [Bacteroidota bacterium]MBU1423778.1 hypothetical protein [Bacteroidota bacterium]MBU2471161.1 hypothetical protein [Bacteroidota bacterium]MBU2636247.1 hypothetical protein [Bacteroidota bacterium]
MKLRILLTLVVALLATSVLFSQATKSVEVKKEVKEKSCCPSEKAAKTDKAKIDHSKMTKAEKTKVQEGCADMKDQKASTEDCAKVCADMDHSKESKAECEKTCSDKAKMKEAKHDCTGKECSHASHSDSKDCDSKE